MTFGLPLVQALSTANRRPGFSLADGRLGLVLLMSALSGRFALATAGIAMRAVTRMDAVARAGLPGQFLGGALLGAVWSPAPDRPWAPAFHWRPKAS